MRHKHNLPSVASMASEASGRMQVDDENSTDTTGDNKFDSDKDVEIIGGDDSSSDAPGRTRIPEATEYDQYKTFMHYPTRQCLVSEEFIPN